MAFIENYSSYESYMRMKHEEMLKQKLYAQQASQLAGLQSMWGDSNATQQAANPVPQQSPSPINKKLLLLLK